MYKLVVVAGKFRGKEFILKDTEITIGRDSQCDIPLPVNGISKKHLALTVTDDVLYLQDLGSANGTFVNDKAVMNATLSDGDMISLPDNILKVVYLKEKKVIVKRNSQIELAKKDFLDPDELPEGIPGKINYVFKYKIMPVFHGLNKDFEWRVLVGIFLAIFVLISVAIIIFPLLSDIRSMLVIETSYRGEAYANMVAKINNQALLERKLDQVDLSFLKNEEGIVSYELFDLEGRIFRPIEKMNEFISDPVAVNARDWALTSDANEQIKIALKNSDIYLAKKIIAFNPTLNLVETFAVLVIQFRPRSLVTQMNDNQVSYLKALISTGLVAIIFFGIIYYLSTRPIEEAKFLLEKIFDGEQKEIKPTLLMEEMSPLIKLINIQVQKIRDLDVNGGPLGGEELESEDKYIAILTEMLHGSGCPAMVLNGDKRIKKINLECEDLTGIREVNAENESIMDVAREKGFAATIMELCDASANSSGQSQEGRYELSGHEYKIYSVGLMGKDEFAKAFYLTFVKDN